MASFERLHGCKLNQGAAGRFERYIRAGGGFVGVYSPMDTEHGWAWYHRLLGADFSAIRGFSRRYTAMGHTTCGYSEEPFLDHLLAGIRYSAGDRASEADPDRAQR